MLTSGTVQFYRLLFMYLKYLVRFSDVLARVLQTYCHFLLFSKQKERYYFQIAHFPLIFNPYLSEIHDHFHIRSGTA